MSYSPILFREGGTMDLDMENVLELSTDLQAGYKLIELADKHGVTVRQLVACLVANGLPIPE